MEEPNHSSPGSPEAETRWIGAASSELGPLVLVPNPRNISTDSPDAHPLTLLPAQVSFPDSSPGSPEAEMRRTSTTSLQSDVPVSGSLPSHHSRGLSDAHLEPVDSSFPQVDAIHFDPLSSPFVFSPKPISPNPTPYLPNTTFYHPKNPPLSISGYFFNLSAPVFAPMCLDDMTGALRYVRVNELDKPVTVDAITQLRIECDLFPHWPISLQPNPARLSPSAKPPPITIGEVFAMIYYCMQLPIELSVWKMLEWGRSKVVWRAYQRRCRLLGVEPEDPPKGMKRIDLCGTEVWFKELIRTPSSGITVMKLILGESSS